MSLHSIRRQRLEHTLPPLRLLRQMYAIIDASVDTALHTAQQALACGEGCGHCCCQPIPATLLEIMGLKLYLRHLCPTEILHSLSSAPHADNCFFLDTHGRCLVYEFRPIACRRFLVGTQPCVRGENPTQTRPQHILEPDRADLLQALHMSAHFYVEHALLSSPPQTMQDFIKVTVLLSSIPWQEEVTHARQGRG